MNKNNNKGFTLVEVLAVVVILGILMTVAMPTYTNVYNSIKRTTYLNKIKTVTIAAKQYANNGVIKDELKINATKDTASQWYKIINISDMIEAGMISSDSETENYIENVYTGKPLGNDSLAIDANKKDGVALVYCYKTYDVDAYVINDLTNGNNYHVGEIVRNIDPVGERTFHEFRKVTREFSYNALYKKITDAYKANQDFATYEGVTMNISEIRSLTDKTPENIRKIVNRLAINNFTVPTGCSHK